MEKERVLNRLIILLLLCLPNANVLEKAKGHFHELMTIASLKGCVHWEHLLFGFVCLLFGLQNFYLYFLGVQFCDVVAKVVLILKKI